MKQLKVKLPISKAEAFASFCFDNGIRNLLSWQQDDFFDGYLISIVAIPEDKIETFQKSDFSKMAA